MRWTVRIVGALAAVWLGAATASAAPISSGILGSARGCSDAPCAIRTLDLVPPNPALTGTLNFQPSISQVTFDVSLASAIFTPVASLGGSDNGVTSLELRNVRYQGSGTLIFLSSTQTWMITGGSAAISGTAIPTGAGGPTSIGVTTPISGGCSQGSGLTTCGIIFSSTQFAVQVNGSTRYFAHTANLTVPEPGGLGLIGLALGALAARRARRS